MLEKIERPEQFEAELRLYMYEPNGNMYIKTIHGTVTHCESIVEQKIPLSLFDYVDNYAANRKEIINRYTFEERKIM